MKRLASLAVPVLVLVSLSLPGTASAASCPGANPCPWTTAGTFGTPFSTTFGDITSVALDGSGNQYLTDPSNNRVAELNSGGTWLRGFGTGGGEGTSYSAGNGSGQLSNPQKAAIDPVTDPVVTGVHLLYVSDSGNNRIEVFNPTNGNFVRSFGSYGSGNGQLSYPLGIGFDTSGNVYVADYINWRIEEFSATGTWIANAYNDVYYPTDVALDASNNLYVSNTWYYARYVAKLAAGTFSFINFIPTGQSPGQVYYPQGLEIDGSGNLYVANADGRIDTFTASSLAYTSGSEFGSVGSANGQFSTPDDIAIDGSMNIYVADQFNDREEVFSSSKVFQYKRTYWGGTTNTVTFNGADGMTLANSSPSAPLWVADYGNNRVLEVSQAGALLNKLGANSGEGGPCSNAPGAFCNPTTVAVDGAGYVYVADTGNLRISKFSPSGTFLQSFGSYGGGKGQFYGLEGVAIDSANDIYASNTYGCRVEELDNTGMWLRDIGGGCGSGPGQFGIPGAVGVQLDPQGNIWVDDYVNSRLEEFNGTTGAFMRQVGVAGSSDGGLDLNRYFAFDSGGELLVADTLNQRVAAFDPLGGSFDFAWGATPANQGAPQLGEFGDIRGVVATSNGSVLVSDPFVDRIQTFQFGTPTASPGAASGIDVESATINGTVSATGGAAAYHFEWGTTSSYGNVTPAGSVGAPGGGVSAPLTGLTPGTTYHWRLVATTPVGSSATADQTFTTASTVQGPPGPGGNQGASGNLGPSGNVGPAGNRGPQGPPGAHGKNAVITCRVTGTKKQKVTCSITFLTPHALQAKLMRRGRLVATGVVASGRGHRTLRLSPAHRLALGRYTLLLTAEGRTIRVMVMLR